MARTSLSAVMVKLQEPATNSLRSKTSFIHFSAARQTLPRVLLLANSKVVVRGRRFLVQSPFCRG